MCNRGARASRVRIGPPLEPHAWADAPGSAGLPGPHDTRAAAEPPPVVPAGRLMPRIIFATGLRLIIITLIIKQITMLTTPQHAWPCAYVRSGRRFAPGRPLRPGCRTWEWPCAAVQAPGTPPECIRQVGGRSRASTGRMLRETGQTATWRRKTWQTAPKRNKNGDGATMHTATR